MKDITLFAALWEGAFEPDAIVPLLRELATRPVARRVPWFAALGSAQEHPDPRVREAALAALRGADGREALRWFIAALDDDDPGVRMAGVEALRALLPRDPMRWAHVVFHRRADVRRASIDVGDDERISELCFFLLSDPACRDALRPMLGTADAEPRLRTPWATYPTLRAFWQRGFVDADEAVRLLAAMPVEGVLAAARSGRMREPEHVALLVDDREQPVEAATLESACADSDGYDGLFEMLVAASDPRVERMCRRLVGPCISLRPHDRRRVLAAARRAMLRRGEDDNIALLCAAIEPRFLQLRALSLELRRGAAAALVTVPYALPTPEELLLSELIEDLVIGEAGLDLGAAGGIVCLARSYGPLIDAVPIDELVAAMAAEPQGAAAILMVPDSSKRGRRWLLERIATHDPVMHAKVLTWLAVYAPTDKLHFVEDLLPSQAVELAVCLTEHELVMDIAHNKRSRLAKLVGACITEADDVIQRLLSFAERFLRLDELESRRFGRVMLETLGNAVGAEAFALAMCGLSTELLLPLVRLLPVLSGMTYGCEYGLASALVEHEYDEIQAWARSRVPQTEPPPRPVPEGVEHLSHAQVRRIGTCTDEELPGVLAPFREVPTLRLTEGLALRTHTRPMAAVCAALLGCHDEPDAVAEQFARFSTHGAAFVTELDELAVRWETCRNLPWLGSAWLWRWERHAFSVAGQMAVAPARPVRFLERTLALPCGLLRGRTWRALGEAVCMWAARDVAAVHALVAGETAAAAVDCIVSQLDTDVDVGAAKLFVGLYRAGVAAAIGAVHRVRALLPDVSEAARAHLSRVLNARGLVARRGGPRKRQRPLRGDELAAIRRSRDLDALDAWFRVGSNEIVQEAALRAVEIGGGALDRMAATILAGAPCRQTLIESVALWSEHPALDRLRAAIDEPEEPELRFRLCLAFAERGDETMMARALSVAAEPSEPGWFRPRDYERLTEARGPLECALALATSPHPHAYMAAVSHLIECGREDARIVERLTLFLTTTSHRLEQLRTDAALYLHARGERVGFPLVLAHALDPDGSYGLLFKSMPDRYVEAVVDAVLLAGPAAVSETRLLQLLGPVHVSPTARDRAFERLLVDAALERTAEHVTNAFASRGVHRTERETLLSRVAEVFAWGTREGLALTRRRHSVHMSDRQHLGYTRFDADRIWVSALPILRGDRHGREIVEALILHEIGHHRHHRGDGAEACWKAAEAEGIHGLLNLVADEHLERNLRALDDSYGDRLKRLAAHAFRHSRRDIRVLELVGVLGHRSFEVLSECELGLAQGSEKVRVQSGKLLAHMEREGLSFARFIRALRMGLGDRYGDDDVVRALKLFKKQFRHSSMEQLLEVARELRNIFGWQTVLSQTYGGHETGGESGREHTRWGRGISDDEVQREVERVLNPDKRRKGAGRGDPSKLWINVSEDEQFDPIHHVERVEPDRKRHREAARDVLRHARVLRSFLDRLGLSSVPVHRRLKGTRIDRGRLTALVTRRDPRVLVSREVVHATDLFVGVVVDCSGSMAGSGHIEKARRFAVLVAEAVRDMHRVDARFFGFTDSVIYDAGDARRCAAASLEAGGGNNDAAALLHAAEIARRSRRRAKLVVMISDGLPTDCSTNALSALVARVQRSGISVAQVAVCPLEEVCFPHYVVLEGDLDPCVRRFGQVIAKLVSRVL